LTSEEILVAPHVGAAIAVARRPAESPAASAARIPTIGRAATIATSVAAH
jgi:hypothetical protein